VLLNNSTACPQAPVEPVRAALPLRLVWAGVDTPIDSFRDRKATCWWRIARHTHLAKQCATPGDPLHPLALLKMGRISLLVRNIPDSLDGDYLKEKFGKFGLVKDVYLPLDYYTKRRRGFAFVEFDDERDAQDAKAEMDRSIMEGR